jgi:hypothetical protein
LCQHTRQPKISDPSDPVAPYQHIPWLEVAVNQTGYPCRRVLHSARDMQSKEQSLIDWQRPP